MRNEENIGHIVRDKRAITTYHSQENCLLSPTVIQHLSMEKNTTISFFVLVIIKFYF